MIDITLLKKEIDTGSFRVCLDSRLIKPGDYFVAVVGEVADGHRYIDSAMDNGAKGWMEEDDLYELAKYKIEKVDPIIVGITGSTGKSSVTAFLTQLLSSKYKVAKGGLNTKLGLSTEVINNISSDCNVFVAEIGMNGLGQIDKITEMYPPHIAVLTTINQTHAEKLGSIENIAKAKSEIINHMNEKDVLVVNKDNEFTQAIGEKFVGKVIWYGESTLNNCDYTFTDFKPLGLHNRLNMLATIRVAEEVGMSNAEIQDQIPNIVAPKGRLNLIPGINGSNLIDDTYNASPVSTKYAIDTLVGYPSKRRIAILGDMLELGNIEIQEHENIGRYVAENTIDVFIGVGSLMKKAVELVKKMDIESYHLDNSAEFEQKLLSHLDINAGDTILIKGSQGIRMEKITEVLMEEPEKAPQLLVRQDIRWK